VGNPGWSRKGGYPSVTVRMDFRRPDVDEFVYRCHILAHEDGGMMQILRVLPAHPQGANQSVYAPAPTASQETHDSSTK
jgi:hypothetical protein